MSISPVGKAYTFKSLANDTIMIGDAADADFHPKFTLNRWNGECWLKLDFDDSQIPENQRTVDLVMNKVEWSAPLFDFHYYPLAQAERHEHGGLEFEIILKAKPSTGTLSFSVQTRNLVFYYQPPLTQELNSVDFDILTETEAWKNGKLVHYRPPEAVGSYAVYHASKRNNQYCAGKGFHIYRPKLIDAAGKTSWASLSVDERQGIMSVTLPQAFLDSAVYPIVVDPTFGYTNIGASQFNNWQNREVRGSKYSATEAGTVSQISAYFNTESAHDYLGGYYTDNAGAPNTRVVQSSATAITTGAKWNNFTVSGSISAAPFWLCVFPVSTSGGANYYFYYDSGDTNQSVRRYMPYGTSEMPNPFGTPDAYLAYKFSVYATYTTGGTLQTVTDALSLGDAVLRNKTLTLTDSLGLADVLFGNKTLLLGDAASLSELVTVIIGGAIKQVSDSVNIADLAAVLKTVMATDTVTLADVALTPSRVLQALEAVGLADNSVVNKVLQITEVVSLAEVVQVGAGGVKKTRLFLVLGDLAVQLTGD